MKANEHSIQSFLSFVRDRFNAYAPLKRYYNDDFEMFFQHYLNHHGFNDYVQKILRGRRLALADICYVGHLYMTHGNRQPMDIPKVLAYLEKFHGLENDTLAPIYTEGYWQSQYENFKQAVEEQHETVNVET